MDVQVIGVVHVTACIHSQESGSSFSYEAERAWLKTRYDKLQKTLAVLTSGPDRLLKSIETKNHTEFV